MNAKNWSNLLSEILEKIARQHLTSSVVDFVMFSNVCSSWHRAASAVKPSINWRGQVPWLMLTEHRGGSDSDNDNDSECYNRNLFNLSNSTTYRLNLSQAYKKSCHGTGTGWILTIGLELDMHLFNPLTKVQLGLPSPRTLPDQPEDSDHQSKEWWRDHYIHRALVVQRPKGRDEKSLFTVVTYWDNYYERKAVAKPGDSKWTPIIMPGPRSGVIDVAYASHLNLVLFLLWDGRIMYWDLNIVSDFDDQQSPISLLNFIPTPSFYPDKPGLEEGATYYLLESFGDILIVRRKVDAYVVQPNEKWLLEKYEYYTYDFDVYKLDQSTKKWEELVDLVDVAIFLGSDPATSVHSSSVKGCKCNSIYYIDDTRSGYWLMTIDGLGGRDIGVFDVTTGKRDKFYHGDDYLSSYSFPIWLLPEI